MKNFSIKAFPFLIFERLGKSPMSANARDKSHEPNKIRIEAVQQYQSMASPVSNGELLFLGKSGFSHRHFARRP